MDTETIPPRSPAQIAASKANGARSAGPTTDTGKAIASMNGVTHGLATRAALLPSERAEDYEANLTGWVATLRPRTPGEGQVVARVADTGFRLDRLAQVEERMVNAALEARVASSAPAKALQVAREALQGVQGLAALAEGVVGPVDATPVARLLPGMRLVAKLVGDVDLPAGPVAALDRAIDSLVIETAISVEPEGFQALATAARDVEAVLQARMAALDAAVEVERERLADLVVLGDGEDVKLLDRHRARLHRELQAQLATVKLLRELAVPDAADGGPTPLVVEVRLVGHRGDGRLRAAGSALEVERLLEIRPTGDDVADDLLEHVGARRVLGEPLVERGAEPRALGGGAPGERPRGQVEPGGRVWEAPAGGDVELAGVEWDQVTGFGGRIAGADPRAVLQRFRNAKRRGGEESDEAVQRPRSDLLLLTGSSQPGDDDRFEFTLAPLGLQPAPVGPLPGVEVAPPVRENALAVLGSHLVDERVQPSVLGVEVPKGDDGCRSGRRSEAVRFADSRQPGCARRALAGLECDCDLVLRGSVGGHGVRSRYSVLAVHVDSLCGKQRGPRRLSGRTTPAKPPGISSLLPIRRRRARAAENPTQVVDLPGATGWRRASGRFRIGSPERRDRILLVGAVAAALLTLLGAAGEAVGLDRRMKANTSKERTHSLLNQGIFYFDWLLTMRDERALPLMQAFDELVRSQATFREMLGVI